jgi:hypothetical protein
MTAHRQRELEPELGLPSGTAHHLELPKQRLSGTFSMDGHDGRGHAVESGLPIEPENLGLQFLHDATAQDYFEGEFDLDPQLGEVEAPSSILAEAPLEGELTDSADLDEDLDEDDLDEDAFDAEAAEDERNLDYEASLSDALARGILPDRIIDVREPDVDLHSAAIHEASLFDHPLDDDELDAELAEENATREPRVDADDVGEPDDARARHIKRQLDARLAQRQRLERLRGGR